MPIEPQSLNVSLRKRNWSWMWFILASIALAIYFVRPVSPAHWAVTILLMAPTVWLVFVGPSTLYYWQLNHRYSFVGWGVVAVRLALLFFVMKVVVPRVIGWVGEFLHG